jgi:hypothetical protein
MKRSLLFFLPFVFVIFLLPDILMEEPSLKEAEAIHPQSGNTEIFDQFISLLSSDKQAREKAIQYVDENWQKSFAIMLIEVLSLSMDPSISRELVDLLELKTGRRFNGDLHAWYDWLWHRPEEILPDYGDFKGRLFAYIDPRFEQYFEGRTSTARIRLDEVRWGGVRQDGIPPLRNPKMITADEASYLDDENVVFGIELNGDIRAYPKRILAWHEMFVDEVGGVPVAGVYCTLCGTVILYDTRHNGITHQLGTSGFLYRSNKLMYDKQTQSLWNTVWGKPVIGPLASQNIVLKSMSVVTTTWGEWRSRHPETQVLSLETGHRRDYGEGVAYADYFATDELMFTVPELDRRLKNKDEILAIRINGFEEEPLALSAKYLMKHPVYHDEIAGVEFVVLTDETGANRVYHTEGILFKRYDKKSIVVDTNDKQWKVFEDKLVSETGRELLRVPYHRAFWFGWYSAYPDTRLVK